MRGGGKAPQADGPSWARPVVPIIRQDPLSIAVGVVILARPYGKDKGDKAHAARALAQEATMIAMQKPEARARYADLLSTSRALADEVGEPSLDGPTPFRRLFFIFGLGRVDGGVLYALL